VHEPAALGFRAKTKPLRLASLALFCQQKVARQATKQRDADGLLERAHPLSAGARRYPQPAGGVLEAQMTGGSFECAQADRRRKTIAQG
jgi:hypothetical protein